MKFTECSAFKLVAYNTEQPVGFRLYGDIRQKRTNPLECHLFSENQRDDCYFNKIKIYQNAVNKNKKV